MKGKKTLSAGVTLLSFLLLIYPGWAQSFTDLHLDPKQVLWTDLSYQAKSFIVNVTSDIQLAPFSIEEFESLWLSNPKSIALPTASREVYRIKVNTIIDHIFSPPVKLSDQVLLEPNQATALHRIKLRRGKDDIMRSYWFSREGVHRLRKKPKTKEEALLQPEQWTGVKRSFYGFDLTRLGNPQVAESTLLIYIVSAYFNNKSNKPLSLCVFGKQQLHQVRLRVDGLLPATVDYTEKSEGTKVRKQGKIEVLRVKLEAQLVKLGQKDPENFSFLGFQKDIAIDINPELRIPVQVSGIIPGVGKVTLKLREVKIRGSNKSNKSLNVSSSLTLR